MESQMVRVVMSLWHKEHQGFTMDTKKKIGEIEGTMCFGFAAQNTRILY